MDDDWGDDAPAADDDGWDDDGDAKVKSADDDGDDWGDGDKTDEWGDAAFDEDAGGGGGDDGGSADLTIDVQIANIFYEAEDIVRENPTSALTKFEQVVEIGTSHASEINDESRTSMFNSLVHITTLLYALGKHQQMIDKYKTLLSFIPKVTRNEGADAIDAVLNAVSNSKDFKLQEQIYSITSTTLKTLPDTDRMLFNVNMKLCKTYVDKEDYALAHRVLEQLHRSCQTPDGQDDKKNKGSELLEIYALEIRISFATNDAVRSKELYEKTKDLSAAVKDPRSQSVIRECWGQMFGDDGQWQRSYAEFYSAFTHYQEIGNRERAKQCLKYVVIANMLSGGEQNPFDAREAKVYQTDPDISAIGSLRTAYEKCDVSAFGAALDEINKTADKFIRTHLDSMVHDFQARAVIQFVKSYRRIRLDYLAQVLRVPVEKIETILIQLILDGEISGVIDQCKGILDLTQRTGGGAKKYAALDVWTGALSQLAQNMTQAQLMQSL